MQIILFIHSINDLPKYSRHLFKMKNYKTENFTPNINWKVY